MIPICTTPSCWLVVIWSYLTLSCLGITLPLTGGSNTKASMVANPRVDLSQFSSSSSIIKQMADIHDRFGTFLFDRASTLGVEPSSLGAILLIESGGKGFLNNQMIIRFENHVFKGNLGDDNLYNMYFVNDPNSAWLGHKYRTSVNDPFQTFHGDQTKEWTVLQFSQSLNDLAALKSASYGAPQIMGFNGPSIGYTSAREMFLAFSNDLEKQMDGMIEFIKQRANCLNGLRTKDFVLFASCYNGSGQKDAYGANILAAYNAYVTVLNQLNIDIPTICSYNQLFGTCAASSCSGQEYSGVSICNGAQCCVNKIVCTPSGQQQPGTCMDSSRCSGQVFSGLCPGSSAIKCCITDSTNLPSKSPTISTKSPTRIPSQLPTQLPTQTNSPTHLPTPKTSTPTKLPTAQLCSPNGGATTGTCMDTSLCPIGSVSIPRFCAGPTNIQCCIPVTSNPTIPPTNKPTTRNPTVKPTIAPTVKSCTYEGLTGYCASSPSICNNPTQEIAYSSTTCSSNSCCVTTISCDSPNNGKCMDTSLCTAAGSIIKSGLCPGSTKIKCCVSPSNSITTENDQIATSNIAVGVTVPIVFALAGIGAFVQSRNNLLACIGLLLNYS